MDNIVLTDIIMYMKKWPEIFIIFTVFKGTDTHFLWFQWVWIQFLTNGGLKVNAIAEKKVSLTTLNLWSLIGAYPVLQIALLFTILYRILSDVIFYLKKSDALLAKDLREKLPLMYYVVSGARCLHVIVIKVHRERVNSRNVLGCWHILGFASCWIIIHFQTDCESFLYKTIFFLLTNLTFVECIKIPWYKNQPYVTVDFPVTWQMIYVVPVCSLLTLLKSLINLIVFIHFNLPLPITPIFYAFIGYVHLSYNTIT